MSTLEPTVRASRFSAYWRLMRFDRPIGILLLLWPTLWALWMAASGAPSSRNAIVFILGVVVMRAAGCVMNDIADRDFDPHVQRTRSRPLAAGELSLRAAVLLLLGLLALAFVLVLLTNPLTIKLAFAGAAFAMTYPFFKRFTHFPQVVLGVAFGWGIPMAFAAETGSVPSQAWWLFIINMVFVLIYDTMYAMVDRDDDLEIGVKSTAIFFGQWDLLVLRTLCLLMLVLLLGLGLVMQLTWPWYVAIGLTGILFLRQQVSIRQRDRQACFKAFLNNNWVGFFIFLGLVVHYQIT